MYTTDLPRRSLTFTEVIFFILCPLVYCAQIASGAHPRECVDSASTLKKVKQCPGNKQQWIQAANSKGCHSIKQNCSSTELFQYHCLLDYTGTGLVEICAPVNDVIGRYCAEYDMKANIIQSRSGMSCKGFEPPCPFKYSSNSSYLFQGCYVSTKRDTKLYLLAKDNSFVSTTMKTYAGNKRGNAGENRSGGLIICQERLNQWCFMSLFLSFCKYLDDLMNL